MKIWKRFPTLIVGVVILALTAVLLGGKALVSGAAAQGTARQSTAADSTAPLSGGYCGAGTPAAFANGKIPTDNIQLAKTVNGVQQATVRVDGSGYSPAVIVIERGKKFVIHFEPTGLNACNQIVNFPDYGGGLDLAKETSTPELTADADFSFSCSMGMLHGYVKVVDDITRVDLNAVKRDVEKFTPSGAGGGCCG